MLEWAAAEERILLTHDVAMITRYAYESLVQTLPVPGVIEIHAEAPIERIIKDLLIVLDCAIPQDLNSQTYYLPL